MYSNLPQLLTSFLGREHEIAEGKRLLSTSRLLTLTGAGGCGKTRLALQLAQEVAGEFDDGVYFVLLASISDPDLVIPTVAQVLGVQETADQPLLNSVKAFLQDKKVLLILDNFEQVDRAALQVVDLLTSAPHAKILVTSRVRLRLQGECEFPVPPMSLPGKDRKSSVAALEECESVRLFVARAKAVKPDFELTSDNASPVAEVCLLLDGLPLAIELAAARAKTLSPQAIVARLGPGGQLKLLTGGARDLPARQQTLRSAIEWSYELLSDDERVPFSPVGGVCWRLHAGCRGECV